MKTEFLQPTPPARHIMASEAALLLAFGNAAVDVTMEVSAEDLSDLGLAAGTDLSGAPQELKERLVTECLARSGDQQQVTAGGAALNSVRVAKWAAGPAVRAAFLGAVGRDGNAEVLREAMRVVGVVPLLHEIETEATGICAVLVESESRDRTLVMRRGAAAHIQASILQRPDFAKAASEARMVYVTSFVLSIPERTRLASKLADVAETNAGSFALNLSSAGILRKVHEEVVSLLPRCRYVFGNAAELAAFASIRGWADSGEVHEQELVQLASRLAEMLAPSGCAVITNGAGSTIIAERGVVARSIPVPEVPREEIVDTNGCGDAFVGGFLSQVLQGGDPSRCVAEAHRCAAHVIRCRGCDLSSLRTS